MAEQEARMEGAEAERRTLDKTVSRAGDRIQEIMDGAERLASEIQSEAEAEAEGYVRDRTQQAERLVEERERLLAELTEGFRARFQRLESELRAALETVQETTTWVEVLADLPAPPPAPTPIAEEAPAPAGEGPDRAEAQRVEEPDAKAEQAPSETVAGEALLRATQMAVSGSGQADIEEALRSEFGIADPEPIVSDLLGRQFDSGPQLGTFTGPASGGRRAQKD